MITIIFESHGTTIDNEKHRASGWNDVALSALGIKQAEELGARHKNETFDAIFCSDLIRSYKTGDIAFAGKEIPIIRDKRLRECDYGDLAGHQGSEVDEKIKRVHEPFPNGESYEQAAARVKDFLEDLSKDYEGKKIMIIGHRATQYGLERWINGTPLEQSVGSHENWKWQPGWKYILKEIKD